MTACELANRLLCYSLAPSGGRAPWSDAEFLGKWLVAAAQAQALWKEAYEKLTSNEVIDRLCCAYIPHFGIFGCLMVMLLREHFTTIVLDLGTETGEGFVVMLGMGFFRKAAEIYQMTLPNNLTRAKLKAAILAYAATEDDDFVLHPEQLVTAMPAAEARAWQYRLRALEDFQFGNTVGNA